MPAFRIRAGVPSDAEQVSHLCQALWPEASWEEHLEEVLPTLSGKPPGTLPAVIFVAETDSGQLAGFLAAGLRSHADGCDVRQPVGFIEGWFVEEALRRRGVGRALVGAAERWARKQGCKEMASDALVENALSQLVHEKLGYAVANRCTDFRKSL